MYLEKDCIEGEPPAGKLPNGWYIPPERLLNLVVDVLDIKPTTLPQLPEHRAGENTNPSAFVCCGFSVQMQVRLLR